jgi:DNA polymerase-3 subunit epsilon
MTGLDVRTDRVVEICVERVVNGATVGRISTLVRPDGPEERHVGGGSFVHGLDKDALAGAPPFSAIADEVLGLFEGAALVAHASEWDVRFLEMEMARAGRKFAAPFSLDTLVLARRSWAFPSYSLDALCTSLAIPRGRAHRADADVAALRALFARCLVALDPKSVRDLWEVKIAERRARLVIVEACQAAVQAGKPVRLTYRPAKRAPQPMDMILTEIRSDLDPPRVIGYQLPGRGRRELRADRILRVEPAQTPA